MASRELKSLDVSKAIDKAAPRTGMFASFATHFEERRQTVGLTQKDIAAHFPSKTGGLTGCVWNWENGANVPTLEQWTVLQPMLGLSSEWLPLIERVEAEREVIGSTVSAGGRSGSTASVGQHLIDAGREHDITTPATPEAQQWQGFGTSLKPAHEPIVVARKPLSGTVAANVLEHGTGALNVDGCRIGTGGEKGIWPKTGRTDERNSMAGAMGQAETNTTNGRWPANVVLSHSPGCVPVGTRRVKGHAGYPNGPGGSSSQLSQKGTPTNRTDAWAGHADSDGMETVDAWDCAPGCAVAELDEQSGELTTNPGTMRRDSAIGGYHGTSSRPAGTTLSTGDSGGASRFFFCAKASSGERSAGLNGDGDVEGRHKGALRNSHPT